MRERINFVSLIFILSLAALPVMFNQAAAEEKMLQAGSSAPDFTAETFDGRTFRLSELYAKGPVVLVFIRGFS